MKVSRLGAGVFTIDDFLTPDECASFIADGEARGYAEAAQRTEDGQRMYGDARSNYRVVFDDVDLATRLFQRASPLLPPVLDGWHLFGFNFRFRYYRYAPGQQFARHFDGTVHLSESRESFLTFLIYLNDGFEGGNTDFGWESVRPVRGTALVFPHRLSHQGATVRSGIKYVLRTDVIYQGGDA